MMEQITSKNPERLYKDIAEFYMNYKGTTLTLKDVMRVIELHHQYNTLDFLYDEKGLMGAVIYNISPTGKVAYILDLVIREGANGLKIMRYFIARGWQRFPTLEYISFERDRKYPYKNRSLYRIGKLIKRRKR